VLVNAWAIGRDRSLWENENSFMPKRFLGSEMDVKGRNFELIPFGGGRRICPGLPLAIRMLHLILGSLIHTFDWKLEDGVKREDMNMEEKFGLTLQIAHPLRAIPIPV
jgi:cytochrome P450